MATGLVRDGAGRVVGVRTDRPDGELRAPVVIACDGVNSFLAKEAGLLPPADAAHYTLGVKEVLGPARRGHRRALRAAAATRAWTSRCSAAPGGIPGGGFLYTNADTVSVGVVLSLPGLAASGVRPEELIADLKAHPAIAPLPARGRRSRSTPPTSSPRAATTPCPPWPPTGCSSPATPPAMTLAAGIWLEGVNFAIGSGWPPAGPPTAAIAAGRLSAQPAWPRYRPASRASSCWPTTSGCAGAPALVLSDRVQQRYPGLLCDLAEGMFTVTNPTPKPGGLRLTRRRAAGHGVKLRELAGDTAAGA